MPEPNSTAQKALADPNDPGTPEDVATLYSWANLHGAKYRDFSASRAQAREEARLRVEEMQAEERRKKEEEAERQRQEEAQIAARLAAEAAEASRQAEAERLAEIARQAEAERQAVLAAQEAQRQAALQRSWQPPVPEPRPAAPRQDKFDHPDKWDKPAEVATMPALHPGSQPGPQPSHQPGFEPSFEPAFTVGIPSFAAYPAGGPLPGAEPGSGAFYDSAPPRAIAAQHPYAQDQPTGGYAPQSPAQSNPYSAPRSYPTPPQPAFAGYPTAQFQHPADAFSSTEAEPFASSPWYPGEPREAQREIRDLPSRPAWLAPEPQVAPPPVTQPVPPAYSYRQPQAAPPVQPPTGYFNQTPIPMAQQGPGPGYGNVSAPGQAQSQPPSPPTHANPGLVDETLVGSRDRIANRWYALKSVFDPHGAPVEQLPAQPPARVPVLAVFSLAGGVGKTSLIASLGRALSSRGERVLLVDTAAYGLLPFFFGARDQRPGMLRTFNPPGVSAEAPIQLVTLDPEGQPPEHTDPNPAANQDPNQPFPQSGTDWLAQEVARYSRGANRILIDLPTASGATTRRVLRLNPVVLVPVLPDMNSVVSVGAIESFFRNQNQAMGNFGPGGGKPILPHYILNQFDYSLPLHLDVREILREQIGDRLLPFALRRSPAVSEALAEGMTVMDYAPSAVVAEDYANLAGWVRGLAAPATQTYRGVRWSER